MFAGGRGRDGVIWFPPDVGLANRYTFQVQPRNPTKNFAAGGECDKRLPSSPHNAGINVALADGSVRFVAPGISPATWWGAVVPNDGNVLGGDWN